MLSWRDAQQLNSKQVANLYRNHINPRQVELLRSQVAGRSSTVCAEGSFITMEDGRKVLDLTGGIGVLAHGHNHPEILRARAEFAAERRMEVHKNFLSPYTAALAANVASMLPGELNYSYFPNSGAEAVEGAVKMAYKYHRGRRDKILVSKKGFHGKTIGAGSLTQSSEVTFRFPEIDGVIGVEPDSLDAWKSVIEAELEKDGSSAVYAILIEPISISEMREVDADTLRGLRELCNLYDISLIFDEVYSGWGRTGYLFNFMRVEGLVPDILVYSKSFGGGKASIAGYTATPKVFKGAYDTDLSDGSLHSTTFFGLAEETVTAIESIRIIQRENFPSLAQNLGQVFRRSFTEEDLSSMPIVTELRGSGAIWGFEFSSSYISRLAALASGLGFIGGLGDPHSSGKKLVAAAFSNILFRDYNILTYVSFNRSAPLIVSFPIQTDLETVKWAAESLKSCLRKKDHEIAAELARMYVTQKVL